MKKEIVVCDFCQRSGTNAVAQKHCRICGKDYCSKHTNHINVTLGGRCLDPNRLGQIAVCESIEVCPDCLSLLTFDHWTTGDQSTRIPELDRPIIKMMLPGILHAAEKGLYDIRNRIGPSNTEQWVCDCQGILVPKPREKM